MDQDQSDQQPASIILIQYPGLNQDDWRSLSPLCMKVHYALRFKRVEYKVYNVRTPGGARRFNPRGRVPALLLPSEGDERGERVSYADSTDILDELDRRFPRRPLLPESALDRPSARILEDWADEVLYFYVGALRWIIPENWARLKATYFRENYGPVVRSIAAFFARREVRGRLVGQGVGGKDENTLRRELRECLDAVESLLENGPYVLGDDCSRADLSIFAMLDQIRNRELTPLAAEELEKRRDLMTWCDRVENETTPPGYRD